MACVNPANQMIVEKNIELASLQKYAQKMAHELGVTPATPLPRDTDLDTITKINTSLAADALYYSSLLKSKETQVKNVVPPTPRRSERIKAKPITQEPYKATLANIKPITTKGSGPFGYLADADETEEVPITLIPTSRRITVQKLINALQAAIKDNPAVAAMEVVPDILDDGNNLGPYEVTIDSNKVFISSGERNPY